MIDREPLREAYPAGCLCAQGISTVGGFCCVRYIPEGSAVGWHFLKLDEGGFRFRSCTVNLKLDEGGFRFRSCIVKEGDTPKRVHGIASMVGESDDDLLPDLTDRATWTHCLADLAKALDLTPSTFYPEDIVTGYSWYKTAVGWRLDVITDSRRDFSRIFHTIDAKNPFLAFLQARIQVRKEKGR
jgi:hypothetical protein